MPYFYQNGKLIKLKTKLNMKKNPVVHFEMPYQDHQRLINFYHQAFGWELTKLDEKMGNYVLATTTETDDKQIVKSPFW